MATFIGSPLIIRTDIERLIADVTGRFPSRELGFRHTDKLLQMDIAGLTDLEMTTLVAQLQVLYPGAF